MAATLAACGGSGKGPVAPDDEENPSHVDNTLVEGSSLNGAYIIVNPGVLPQSFDLQSLNVNVDSAGPDAQLDVSGLLGDIDTVVLPDGIVSLKNDGTLIGDISLFDTANNGLEVEGSGNLWLLIGDSTAPGAFDGSVQLKVTLAGGDLTFDMPSDADQLTLLAGTVIDLGGGALIVSDGKVFANAAEVQFLNIGSVILNSELIITFGQFTDALNNPDISITGAGKLTVLVDSDVQASEVFDQLIQNGSMGQIGDFEIRNDALDLSIIVDMGELINAKLEFLYISLNRQIDELAERLEGADYDAAAGLQLQIDALTDRLNALEAGPEDWANYDGGNAANIFTVAEVFGTSSGSVTVLNTFVDGFATRIEGYDPVTVPLTVEGDLTVAQAVALAEAGLQVASEDVVYDIRDAYVTVQAALANPDANAALAGAQSVIAYGNNNPNAIDMIAFGDSINLRIEALGGDDTISSGPGGHEIVGGRGSDTIWLTDDAGAQDTVVYQTLFDGRVLPVTTVTFSNDPDDYRIGSTLTLTVNGIFVNYTVTLEGVSAADAIRGFATVLINEASITDALLIQVDGLELRILGLPDQRLRVEDGTGSGDDRVQLIENDGQQTVATVTFPATALGWPTQTNEPSTSVFDRSFQITIDVDGQDYTVTADVAYDTLGEVQIDQSMLNMVTAINENQGLSGAVTASADGAVLTVAAVSVGANSFAVTGASIDTNGVQHQTELTFSSNDADYFAGGSLRALVDGAVVEAAMVAGDAAASIANLVSALEQRIGLSGNEDGSLNGILERAVLVEKSTAFDTTKAQVIVFEATINDQQVRFEVAYDPATWGVSEPGGFLIAETSTNAVSVIVDGGQPLALQTVNTISFALDNGLIAGASLSLTDGNSAYGLSLTSMTSATITLPDQTPNYLTLEAAIAIIHSANDSLPKDTSILLTAATEGDDPLNASAQLDFEGELQQAILSLMEEGQYNFFSDGVSLEGTDRGAAVYFDDGQVHLTIRAPGQDGTFATDDDAIITITANMASDAEGTMANLRDAIALQINESVGDGALQGSLFGIISDVSVVDGNLTLTAATPGQETFRIENVYLDYQGVQQIATIRLDSSEGLYSDHVGTLNEGTRFADVYGGGKVFVEITVGTVTYVVEADMADNAAGTANNLAVAINAMATEGHDLFGILGINGATAYNGSITVTAASTDTVSFTISAVQMDYAGVTQLATVTLDAAAVYEQYSFDENGNGITIRDGAQPNVYFEGGKVYLEITPVDGNPIVVSADMVVGGNPHEYTTQALVDAINDAAAQGGALDGIIASGGASVVNGTITLEAAVAGEQTFSVSDVRMDYQGLKQIAEVDFAEFYPFQDGSVSLTLQGTDPVGAPIIFSEANITELVAAIQAQIDGTVIDPVDAKVSVGDGVGLSDSVIVGRVGNFQIEMFYLVGEDHQYFSASISGNSEIVTISINTIEGPVFTQELPVNDLNLQEFLSLINTAKAIGEIDILPVQFSVEDSQLVMVPRDEAVDVTIGLKISIDQLGHVGVEVNDLEDSLGYYTVTGSEGSNLPGSLTGLISTVEQSGGTITLTSADNVQQQFEITSATASTQGAVEETAVSFRQGDDLYFNVANDGETPSTGTVSITILDQLYSVDMQETQAATLDALGDLLSEQEGFTVGRSEDGTVFTITGETVGQPLGVSASMSVNGVLPVTVVSLADLDDSNFIAGIGQTVTLTVDGQQFTVDGASRLEILQNLQAELFDALDSVEGNIGNILDANGIAVDEEALTLTLTGRFSQDGNPFADTSLSQLAIDTDSNANVAQQISLSFSNTNLTGLVGRTATLEIEFGQTSATLVLENLETIAAVRDSLEAALYAADLVGSVEFSVAGGFTIYTLTADVFGPNVLGDYPDGQFNTITANEDGQATEQVQVTQIDAGSVGFGQPAEIGDVNSASGIAFVPNDPLSPNVLTPPLEIAEDDVNFTNPDANSGFYGDAPQSGENGEGIQQNFVNPDSDPSLYGDDPLRGGIDDGTLVGDGVNQSYTNPTGSYIALDGSTNSGENYSSSGNDTYYGDNSDSVGQTYTNPENGYTATEGSPQPNNGETDGDAALSGSDPGYYDENGLWTSHLNGGTVVSQDGEGNNLYTNDADGHDLTDLVGSGDTTAGQNPGAEDVHDTAIVTVIIGFDDFDWGDGPGEAMVLVLNRDYADADVIHNFQVEQDKIAFEGDFASLATGSREGSLSEPAFGLGSFGFGLVNSDVSNLSVDDIGDATQVAARLADLFGFSTTQNNGSIDPTIFAVTASDDDSVTAIWAHQQSSTGDNTVDAGELFLLATVNTIDGAFGLDNFDILHTQVVT